jgi:hypothetical protein
MMRQKFLVGLSRDVLASKQKNLKYVRYGSYGVIIQKSTRRIASKRLRLLYPTTTSHTTPP